MEAVVIVYTFIPQLHYLHAWISTALSTTYNYQTISFKKGMDKKWKQFKLFALRLRNNDTPPLPSSNGTLFQAFFSFAIECNIYETDSTLGPIKKIREGWRYQIR